MRGSAGTPHSGSQAERQRQATRPGLAVRGTFSPARAWRPAVVARLARTLGHAMQHLITFAMAVSAGACAQQGPVPGQGSSAPQSLVRITAGGDLIELERTAEYSLMEVRSAPSGSVPASMFALRGACSVARARGQTYFASNPEPGSSSTHRITFPKSPYESQLRGSTKTVFTLAECQLLQF